MAATSQRQHRQTKPDTRVREYEHNGIKIAIKPSVDGLATVHDRDVLIYCISQLMTALNEGREVSQVVRFRAFDMLVATNRNTTGSGYASVADQCALLERILSLLVPHGSERQRALRPVILTMKARVAYCIAEADAGTDVSGIRTTAVRDGAAGC